MSEIQETNTKQQDIQQDIQQQNTQQDTQQQDTQRENTETDLNLNTDIIHNRTTTYASLSELYGVQLFTNQRLEEKQSYEESLNLKEKNVAESIFVDKSATKDVDREVIQKVFQEPLVIAKQQEYTGTAAASRGMFAVGAIFISIIFIMLLIKYLKPGKKRKTTEETNYE